MFEDSTHGGRQRNRAGLWGRIISTHALTEGDYASPAVKESYIKFQLTPSRRATIADDQVRVVLLFQLTPSRRATQPVFLPHIRVFHFNSRPHGGRRQI